MAAWTQQDVTIPVQAVYPDGTVVDVAPMRLHVLSDAQLEHLEKQAAANRPVVNEESVRADERERIAKHLEDATYTLWNGNRRSVSNWKRAADEVRALGSA